MCLALTVAQRYAILSPRESAHICVGKIKVILIS